MENRTIIYSDFGMYTRSGNRSISNKFNSLVNKLGEDLTIDGKVKVVCKFLRGYRALAHTASYSESTDTAVREAVWDQLVNIGESFGMPRVIIDWIWEETDY